VIFQRVFTHKYSLGSTRTPESPVKAATPPHTQRHAHPHTHSSMQVYELYYCEGARSILSRTVQNSPLPPSPTLCRVDTCLKPVVLLQHALKHKHGLGTRVCGRTAEAYSAAAGREHVCAMYHTGVWQLGGGSKGAVLCSFYLIAL
jgi:hypothetical protein